MHGCFEEESNFNEMATGAVDARLVMKPDKFSGKDKDWAGLTNAERISASNLGFDQAMWDAGDSPEACAIPFARLNTTFKISAQALGPNANPSPSPNANPNPNPKP